MNDIVYPISYFLSSTLLIRVFFLLTNQNKCLKMVANHSIILFPKQISIRFMFNDPCNAATGRITGVENKPFV